MQIIGVEDCANSPKNQFVARCAVALAGYDTGWLRATLIPGVNWIIAGSGDIEGVDALLDALPVYLPADARRIEVRHALSHGLSGAVDGLIRSAGGMEFLFCHMIEFSSVKATHISRITSWITRTG